MVIEPDKKEYIGDGTVEYSLKLSTASSDNMAIYFISRHQEIEVYANDNLIYYVKAHKSIYGTTTGTNYSIVNIPSYTTDVKVKLTNVYEGVKQKETTFEYGDVKAECVVTDEGNEILEIKNIAVDPQNQGKGYGKALIDFLAGKYADEYSVLQVGTGDSPLTIPFYEKCGFVRSHKIHNFFTDNYDHTIYEGGVQLIDMVYLQRHI